MPLARTHRAEQRGIAHQHRADRAGAGVGAAWAIGAANGLLAALIVQRDRVGCDEAAADRLHLNHIDAVELHIDLERKELCVSKTILVLAMYGLEIVEVGGTLALHAQRGDAVYGAVLLARPESRAPVRAAAQVLGVRAVRYLDFAIGEVQADLTAKQTLVRLLRELRPDILITQDPEHVQHDFDPDRRPAMTLFQEAFALAGRDWHVDACGGFASHTVRDWYYMTPERPNCVVEIGPTFGLKQQALAQLDYQLAYSAQVQRARLGDAALRHLLPEYETLKDDDLALGAALHQAMDRAGAMQHGLLNHHAHAALAEAFRHEGPFTLSHL